MKLTSSTSLFIVPIFLFLSGSIFSQEKEGQEMESPMEPITYLQVRKSKDLSSFTLEVIDNDEFDYKDFLSESKMSDDTYEVGAECYTKKELTKFLRKGGRKSKTVRQFLTFLEKENFTLSKQLTSFELELLHDKFREGTLDEYLEELPSVF